MARFYTALLYLLTPLVVGRLLFRSWQIPGYRQRLGERFGLFPPLAAKETLWVHAVSVGEVQAAAPLLRALTKRYPHLPLLVTTTTPTGAQQLQNIFGDQVLHRYAPYDLPGAVKRFLQRTRPRLLVLVETELWPNLICTCHQAGIPVVLANARLSARSAQGYSRLMALTQMTLNCLSALAVQTPADGQRLLALGAPPERLTVTGNIKFDLTMAPSLAEEGASLRRQLGTHRPVWIAASTHSGEEELILAAHAHLRQVLPNALLILVPRHPERFSRVAVLCRRSGFALVSWSDHHPCQADTAVYLGDTMGRLPMFYAAADLAFVGGSLVPTGGHNLLEPAALGLPTLQGPHHFNFAEVTRLLEEAGVLQEVANSEELAAKVAYWLQDANLRHAMGERARAVINANRGALARLLTILQQLIPEE